MVLYGLISKQTIFFVLLELNFQTNKQTIITMKEYNIKDDYKAVCIGFGLSYFFLDTRVGLSV